MQTAEIVYGRAGQVVEFYAPECVRDCLGIPTSVTANVYFGQDSNDDAVEFSPIVAVDPMNTTVSASSGQTLSATRNRVGVNDTTDIAPGVLYLLDNACQQREVIEPKKIVDGSTIDLVHDLQYDYATSVSILKGIRCYFTVDASWVATETNILVASEPSYRVIWTYTVAGSTYSAQTYLRLVRKPWRSTITYQDVVARWPDILQGQPREMRGEKLSRLIAAAEETVRSDIHADGYKPEQINDTENIDRLVNHALDYQIARFWRGPADRDRESFILECKKEYGELFAKLISNLKVDIDVGIEGASVAEPEQRLFFTR